MRAAVFKQFGEPWVVETVPDPEPKRGEAVIKVGRCGICGSDLAMTSDPSWGVPCNSVIGHEFSGEVVARGAGVERLKVGELVTAMPVAGCGECPPCKVGMQVMCSNPTAYMGGYGEYMRIAERTAVKLPASLSLGDGALVEPLAVGLHGVALAKMPPGSRVLVLGAGAVGLVTIFWARRLGAGRIVAASRSRRRGPHALALGADSYVLTGEDESERINEALGGPPDYVFETIGVPGAMAQCIRLVKPMGEVISLGFCSAPDPIEPRMATWKQIKLTFSMAWTLPDFQYAVDSLDRGWIAPRDMVSNVIGLRDLPAKIEELRGGHAETKVHVDPWL